MTILKRVLFVSFLAIASILWFNPPVWGLSSQNTSDVFNRGLNNLRHHHYQAALVDFTQVIDRQDILVGAAYSNRCLVNLQLQNNVASVADCMAALENNPDNIEAYLNLGLAYYHQGEYQKAIAKYQRVIQLDKQDYRAYYNRGLAYSALSNHQKAIADYQTALMYSPESEIDSKSVIHNDLALAYMMLAQNQQAVLNFDKAIALNENNYHAYYNRGCAYHLQGKHRAAIQDFSQVVQLQPDFTQAYVHRGIVRHQIGAKDTAFKDLNLALQQYQNKGDREQYDLLVHLKKQLFYTQPSQIA